MPCLETGMYIRKHTFHTTLYLQAVGHCTKILGEINQKPHGKEQEHSCIGEQMGTASGYVSQAERIPAPLVLKKPEIAGS